MLTKRNGYCTRCCNISDNINVARYGIDMTMTCNVCVDIEFNELCDDPSVIGSEAYLMEGPA